MSRARAEMIEDTRARLIASARRAFATQGYANTSMDDFTARAGLTRGALYHPVSYTHLTLPTKRIV